MNLPDTNRAGHSIQKEALSHLSLTNQTVNDVQQSLTNLNDSDLDAFTRSECVRSLGSKLQDTYTGFEAVITRILKSKGVRFEKSESHHQQLLDAAITSGVITDESASSCFYDLGKRNLLV